MSKKTDESKGKESNVAEESNKKSKRLDAISFYDRISKSSSFISMFSILIVISAIIILISTVDGNVGSIVFEKIDKGDKIEDRIRLEIINSIASELESDSLIYGTTQDQNYRFYNINQYVSGKFTKSRSLEIGDVILVEKGDSIFSSYEDFVIDINKDLLEKVLNSTSSITEFRKIGMFSNIVNVRKNVDIEYVWTIPIILLIIVIALSSITRFAITDAKGTKLRGLFGSESRNKEETTTELLKHVRSETARLITWINHQNENNLISEENQQNFKDEVKNLRGKLKNLNIQNSLRTLMKVRGDLIEKSNLLEKRADLMLILGLLVALIGLIVFYITIPSLEKGDRELYLLKSIRPIFVLIFIEGISLYLLRQYRVAINDQKEYYNLYLAKNYQFQYMKFLLDEELNEQAKKDIMTTLEKFNLSVSTSPVEKISRMSESEILKLILKNK